MKIDARKFALATAVVVAGLYIICWALVAALPDSTMALTEDMLHMRMKGVAWHMGPRSLLVGALVWAIVAGIGAWLVGALYNRLCLRDGV